MDRLLAGGVTATAVHNHLLRESPRIVYMHVDASGDPTAIAATIQSALAVSNTPPPPTTSSVSPTLDLDTALVHRVLGHAGKPNGGVYQVNVPRRETIRLNGEIVPSSMGVSTAINFQPTGAGKAAITGDFVMQANEVSRVIVILRRNNIVATALHTHMIGEDPKLYFMHFWANDDVARLATALRAALDQLK